MVQRNPMSGGARGRGGAQPAVRRLPAAAGRGALRWGVGAAAQRAKRRRRASAGRNSLRCDTGAAQRAKRPLLAGSWHESRFGPSNPQSEESEQMRGSGGVQTETSSVAAQQPNESRFVMPFAGVSVLANGMLCPSTRSVIDAGAASGYHLLVVESYSQNKKIPNGLCLRSRPFVVGGYHWCIDYLPNGFNSHYADYISLFAVLLDDNVAKPVRVWFRFSFIDEVEKQDITHIRAADTSSFYSHESTWGVPRFIKRDAFEKSKNLKGDCFTIRFDIMICEDLNTEDAGVTQVPLSGISQHLNYLLQTKVGADVTFEVSGETFAAHRCVLAARSTVFMAQLFGPVKEGPTADVIEIKDMKPEVLKALLSFIYTDSFLEMEKQKKEVETEAMFNEVYMWLQWLGDLIVAADRYALQHLKFSCEELLSKHIGLNTVSETLYLALQHHCHRVKEACLQFLQDQSSSSLRTIMASDRWKHIIMAYPSVLNELIVKLAARCNTSDNATIRYVVPLY